MLDIQVTRLEKTSFKESFDGLGPRRAGQEEAQPYFVRGTVKNRGTTDLAGRPVPLYIVDGNNVLIEATAFASTFKPCSPGKFPRSSAPGKKADVCLVYLSPNKGDLTAVSFGPTRSSTRSPGPGSSSRSRSRRRTRASRTKGDKGN